MKKFGTPIGAAPGSACEKVGLAGGRDAVGLADRRASGLPLGLASLDASSSASPCASSLPIVSWPCWPPAETDGACCRRTRDRRRGGRRRSARRARASLGGRPCVRGSWSAGARGGLGRRRARGAWSGAGARARRGRGRAAFAVALTTGVGDARQRELVGRRVRRRVDLDRHGLAAEQRHRDGPQLARMPGRRQPPKPAVNAPADMSPISSLRRLMKGGVLLPRPGQARPRRRCGVTLARGTVRGVQDATCMFLVVQTANRRRGLVPSIGGRRRPGGALRRGSAGACEDLKSGRPESARSCTPRPSA